MLTEALQHCHQMTSLKFPLSFEISDSMVKALNQCCSLKALNLCGSTISSHQLSSLNLPTLTEMNLSSCTQIRDLNWKVFASKHPQIQQLNLKFSSISEKSFFKTLELGKWQLKTLKNTLSKECFIKILPFLSGVKSLKISDEGNRHDNLFLDEDLDLISEYCPNLKELELFGLKIKGTALERIAAKCPLKKVTPSECFEIESDSFINFAKNCSDLNFLKLKGVSFNMNALEFFKTPLKTLEIRNWMNPTEAKKMMDFFFKAKKHIRKSYTGF